MSEDDERADELDSEADGETPEAELPLSSLRDRIDAERGSAADESPLSEVAEESADTEADGSELFEEVEVGDVDSEAVWDAVVEGESDPEAVLGKEPRAEPDAEPAAEPTGTPDEHVIDKREYCQRCEYFSEPPDVACNNPGTEIVELVDNDHFRVRECPKVAADDEALSGFAAEETQSGE